jgi:hypothetical protein
LEIIVASDKWWEENTKVRNLSFISMFMKMVGETIFYASMLFVQGHMQREKKICHFDPPNCVEDVTIMFERSRALGLSTCIHGAA